MGCYTQQSLRFLTVKSEANCWVLCIVLHGMLILFWFTFTSTRSTSDFALASGAWSFTGTFPTTDKTCHIWKWQHLAFFFDVSLPDFVGNHFRATTTSLGCVAEHTLGFRHLRCHFPQVRCWTHWWQDIENKVEWYENLITLPTRICLRFSFLSLVYGQCYIKIVYILHVYSICKCFDQKMAKKMTQYVLYPIFIFLGAQREKLVRTFTSCTFNTVFQCFIHKLLILKGQFVTLYGCQDTLFVHST